jgi:hypothetical protein
MNTWSRHSVLTDLTQRSAIALARGDLNGDARLGDTEITYAPIEAGAIAGVAVMNEKTWRLALPVAAFDNLLSRPFGGWMQRYVHVENLPAGVMDHEEHVQRSKRYGLDTKKVARPDGRRMLPQE